MKVVREPSGWWLLIADTGLGWDVALRAYDRGNREYLAEYVERTDGLSADMRCVLADIVRNVRKPDGRGKELVLTDGIKAEARLEVSYLRDQRDAVLTNKVAMEQLADKRRLEYRQAVAFVEEQYRVSLREIADRYDVTVKTLEDAVKPSRIKK